MTQCSSSGRILVGTMYGFSGSASGETQKIARRHVFEASGLYEASSILMKNAMTWECDGDCETRTGLSVTPEPVFRQDPISGFWSADLNEATLKVWVECVERTDRSFEKRAGPELADTSVQFQRLERRNRPRPPWPGGNW